MAVGNPYGQLAYGTGPYARFGSARAYGIGAYGIAVYGGWGGNTFDVGGRAALHWSATANAHVTYQPWARTSIVWNVVAYDPTVEMHPWAISEIVFSMSSELEWSWSGYQPCEVGIWAAAPPCETGTWQVPIPCTQGSWQPARLT